MTRNKPTTAEEASIREGKVYAVLGYLSILCILPLIFKKDNAFVLSHSKQGLVIFVLEVGLFILSIIFPWILRLGMFILFALSFAGIIAALKGKYISLPVVADISKKITL